MILEKRVFVSEKVEATQQIAEGGLALRISFQWWKSLETIWKLTLMVRNGSGKPRPLHQYKAFFVGAMACLAHIL
jgi:hypothetical protein